MTCTIFEPPFFYSLPFKSIYDALVTWYMDIVLVILELNIILNFLAIIRLIQQRCRTYSLRSKTLPLYQWLILMSMQLEEARSLKQTKLIVQLKTKSPKAIICCDPNFMIFLSSCKLVRDFYKPESVQDPTSDKLLHLKLSPDWYMNYTSF